MVGAPTRMPWYPEDLVPPQGFLLSPRLHSGSLSPVFGVCLICVQKLLRDDGFNEICVPHKLRCLNTWSRWWHCVWNCALGGMAALEEVHL